jgi:hypothetical protein
LQGSPNPAHCPRSTRALPGRAVIQPRVHARARSFASGFT